MGVGGFMLLLGTDGMDCTLWTIKTTTRAPNNANNDVLHLSKRGPAASIRWRGRSVSAPSHTFQPWFNLFRENRNPQTPVSQPAFWNEKFLHQLDIKTSHEKKSISITSNTLLQPSYSRQTQIMYQHQITTCGMFFIQSGKFGVCQKKVWHWSDKITIIRIFLICIYISHRIYIRNTSMKEI